MVDAIMAVCVLVAGALFSLGVFLLGRQRLSPSNRRVRGTAPARVMGLVLIFCFPTMVLSGVVLELVLEKNPGRLEPHLREWIRLAVPLLLAASYALLALTLGLVAYGLTRLAGSAPGRVEESEPASPRRRRRRPKDDQDDEHITRKD
jgi:hypothetical protein